MNETLERLASYTSHNNGWILAVRRDARNRSSSLICKWISWLSEEINLSDDDGDNDDDAVGVGELEMTMMVMMVLVSVMMMMVVMMIRFAYINP